MILGIDASNISSGGGVTHLVELLRAADPLSHGFQQVVVWSKRSTLAQIESRRWLVKAHLPVFEKGLLQRTLWQRFSLSGTASLAHCDVLFVPGGSYAGTFRPMVTMSQNLLPFEWYELRRFGWSWLTLKWLLLRRTQSRTFRHADGVIFLTKYAKDAVVKITGDLSCRTAIVPHGVRDLFASPPREQMNLDQYSFEQPFRILYVSAIDMYKHQWHVAEAVSMLRGAGLPVELELVGPSYPPALTRLNEALGRLDPTATYLKYNGVVPHQEMHLYYRQSDLAVFASSCETFGQIVVEAMSAGLPIACSNRSAMQEILLDTAVYFDPEDSVDIAKAIKQLIVSPKLRSEKAWAGFRRVQQFTWAQCANDTLEMLGDAANSRRVNSTKEN